MSGKAYNGEKAVISLTSWKARINTVGLTIFSLLAHCPGFHIVLVLSEDEFPQKENELPNDINVLVHANKIEILWVIKNIKSFKKILPTCVKYPNIPVISADDDCIYVRNYAQELYNEWLNNRTSVITTNGALYNNLYITRGISTLFPPHYCECANEICDIAYCNQLVNDDAAYAVYNQVHGIDVIDLHGQTVAYFQHQIEPLSQDGYKLDKDLDIWYNTFIYRPLISSDCISGHMYKDLNLIYPHPFMWTVLKPFDLLKLITGWKIIDFTKIQFSKSDCLADKFVEYKVNIDNKVDAHYIHVKQSSVDKVPRKVAGTKYGGDIYIDDPPKLISRQYNTRLTRLKSKIGMPIFLINENPVWGYTHEVLEYIMSLKIPNLYCISDKVGDHYLTVSTSENNNYKSGRTLRLYFAVKNQLMPLLLR